MNILDIMKTTQQGGPPEAEVQEYMKNNKLTPEKLVEKYHEAVKKDKEKKAKSGHNVGQIRTKKGWTERAHGGYVKKYAKGGGVRKVRT